jgi:four helix bundle protein
MILKKIPYVERFEPDKIQLVRSSGSVGANYIEANESLGKRDFLFKLKICRKEAKESVYWLRLIHDLTGIMQNEVNNLIDEANQLKKIFSSIIEKSK